MKSQNKNQKLVDAALVASTQLVGQKVNHCLVGRLALAAHGYEAGEVSEIDFLLNAGDAFAAGKDGLCVTKAGLPLSVGDVRVKWATLELPWEQTVFREELIAPERQSGEVPIGSMPLILCLLAMSEDKAALRAAFDDGAGATEAVAILGEHVPHLADMVKNIYDSRER